MSKLLRLLFGLPLYNQSKYIKFVHKPELVGLDKVVIDVNKVIKEELNKENK